MKYYFRFFLLGIIALTFIQCDMNHKEDDLILEEKLLYLFKNELKAIKTFQKESYIKYLEYQILTFKEKQIRLNGIIKSINNKFASMDQEEQSQYQKKWALKFQPLINSIDLELKNLSYSYTANLTPKRMATIQKLVKKISEQEKSVKKVDLKPKFFITP